MCQKLCSCLQESSPDNSSPRKATPNNMADNVAESDSSCVCPKKRKECDLDELPYHCGKATKPNSSDKMCTSGDTFIKVWMLPSAQAEIIEEQVDPWVDIRAEKWNSAQAERWDSVRGHDKVFMNEKPKGKNHRSNSDKITRKMSELKEMIAVIELSLEEKAGHPLSKADKLKDEELNKQIRKLDKLKMKKKDSKDKKERKEKPLSVLELRDRVEVNMAMFREKAARPFSLEDMTMAEKEAEKSDLAAQMKQVEAQLGGLVAKEIRDVLFGHYLRLRQLKRITRKPSYTGAVLTEIPENESIEVVGFSSRRSSADSYVGDEEDEDEEDTEDDEVEEKSEEEEWHTMTRSELKSALRGMRERKVVLGRDIKEFQQKILLETGRKATKEDREPIKLVYNMYKQIKLRIRLVDALLSKLSINNIVIN